MFDNISEKNINIFKIVLMIGLIITMIILSIVIIVYGSAIKEDPCNFCNCIKNINYSLK